MKNENQENEKEEEEETKEAASNQNGRTLDACITVSIQRNNLELSAA